MLLLHANDIAAIVLRFRDKGDVKSTIESHQKIIDEKKSVWWGWWAKDYENIPKEYFEDFKNKLKSGKKRARVFLLHTKEKLIYEAICEEIQYGENCAIPSPNEEMTPQYYNQAEVKAWFRFKQIRLVSEDELLNNKFSFMDDLPQFLYSEPSVEDEYESERGKIPKNHLYASFGGYRVSTLDEFLVQKRTIWFLKKKGKADGMTPFQEWLPMPSNFASHYTRTASNSLLVLSDLHFAATKPEQHRFSQDEKSGYKISLLEAVIRTIHDRDIKIGGVLVAGDFTFIPQTKDFELAADFLERLMGDLNVKTSQLAIVPGNHDIAYDPLNPATEDILEASDESKRPYREFYKRIYHSEPNKFFSGSKRIMLGNGLPVEIICLNSNVLQQEEDLFLQGMVGDAQLRDVINEMDLKNNVPSYTYRIILLHHHLLAANFSKEPKKRKHYSALLDSGRVCNFINTYGIDLVIHGHEHEELTMVMESQLPKSLEGTMRIKPYHILGMGSAGSNDLGPGIMNSFGVLNFDEYGKVKFTKFHIYLDGRPDDSPQEYVWSIW